MVLDVATHILAMERLRRMERTNMAGRFASQAMFEIGGPVSRALTALGSIRARTDFPAQLQDELRKVETDVSCTKGLRDKTLAFLASRFPDKGSTSVDELLYWLRAEMAEILKQSGIVLELKRGAGLPAVRGDGFLLRCALKSLVEHSFDYLCGYKGGRISVTAQASNDNVQIVVSDNSEAVRGRESSETIPKYLAWCLDKKSKGAGLSFVKTVVEHYKGEWRFVTHAGQGIVITLILPAGGRSR